MQVVCVVMSNWRNHAKGDEYEQGNNFHCVCNTLEKAVEVIEELIPYGNNGKLEIDKYKVIQLDVDSEENIKNEDRERLYISLVEEYGDSPDTTYTTMYYVQFTKVL